MAKLTMPKGNKRTEEKDLLQFIFMYRQVKEKITGI